MYCDRFSALQRAENSSIILQRLRRVGDQLFQCSSASRKFLNLACMRRATGSPLRFSALQRAENSSIPHADNPTVAGCRFQCSSASRKFLNCKLRECALQVSGFQCSSASRKFLNRTSVYTYLCGIQPFQCSSASRKFLNSEASRR